MADQGAAGRRGPDPARGAVDNPVGLGLLLTGAVLVLAAFTVLDWFRGRISFPGTGRTAFPDVRHFLDRTRAQLAASGIGRYFSSGVAGPYFGWLGWLLLAAAAAGGLLAVSRTGRDHWSARWLGAVVAATGVGLTLSALDLVIPQGNPPRSVGLPSYGDYLSNSSIGAWAALLGFTLMGAASLWPHRPAG